MQIYLLFAEREYLRRKPKIRISREQNQIYLCFAEREYPVFLPTKSAERLEQSRRSSPSAESVPISKPYKQPPHTLLTHL